MNKFREKNHYFTQNDPYKGVQEHNYNENPFQHISNISVSGYMPTSHFLGSLISSSVWMRQPHLSFIIQQWSTYPKMFLSRIFKKGVHKTLFCVRVILHQVASLILTKLKIKIIELTGSKCELVLNSKFQDKVL